MFSLYPSSAAGKPVAFGGSALDLAAGVFINRTKVEGCGVGAVLEQRWYAHRALRSLLVYEVELLGSTVADAACSVVFAGCNGSPKDTNTTVVSTSADGVVSSRCVTKDRETTATPLATVGRVFKQPPTTMTVGSAEQRFVGVLTTSLPDEGAARQAPCTSSTSRATWRWPSGSSTTSRVTTRG